MDRCGFCGGGPEAVGQLTSYENVTICAGCAESFSHQLGHQEGRCSNCGREMPEAMRLHGEGDVTICEVCLQSGPSDSEHQPDLTHLNDQGEVHMVDVGDKATTERRAVAEAVVQMSPTLAERLFSGDLPKGDALATVRLAGIMAAKRTPDLIPLAHPISLSSVSVSVEPHPDGARIEADCSVTDRTGVEMEALTAAAVAALALYDMVKSIERGVVIGPVRLLRKSGGRSGLWEADSQVSLSEK